MNRIADTNAVKNIAVVDGALTITETTTSIMTKEQLTAQITQKTKMVTAIQSRLTALQADIATDQTNLANLANLAKLA